MPQFAVDGLADHAIDQRERARLPSDRRNRNRFRQRRPARDCHVRRERAVLKVLAETHKL
jgi:hypothetical protein